MTEELYDVIAHCDRFSRGVPPIAGGGLDQAKIFLDAEEFVALERRRWESELRSR